MKSSRKILFAAATLHGLHSAFSQREGQEERNSIGSRSFMGVAFALLAAASIAAATKLLPAPEGAPSPCAPAAPDAAAKGAAATSPAEYSWPVWKSILGRVWIKNGELNLSLMAAGVAFYAFLSFVPLLAAMVMTYGLVADPATISQNMRTIIDVVPAEAARLIYEQLVNLTTSAANRKGLGLVAALAVSIYGASRASGAVIAALNVIYNQPDKRGFFKGAWVSILLIMGAVVVGILGVVAASLVGYAQAVLKSLGSVGIIAVQITTWLTAAGLCCIAIGAMYRFAPDRADARWRWLSYGSVAATLLWLVATIGFGIYAARFGNYNATYGSLGAVVILLMWLFVSAYAILIGGLINAEAERQTAIDSTTGPPRPMGERDAAVADTSAALADA